MSSNSPLRAKKQASSNDLGKKNGPKDKDDGYNIKVAVRCRPLNAEERASNQHTVCSIDYDTKSVNVSAGPDGRKFVKSYAFDNVFGTYSTQKDVFEEVAKPILSEVLKGLNCSIFAYGQTGTGKTHTIEGDINNPEDSGIVPRSVLALFTTLTNVYGKANVDFTARVSFLEIYNEELTDLLTKSANPKKLGLFDDAKKGVLCTNLEEMNVKSADEVFDLMAAGIDKRQVAATLMNKNSSRSHTIFTIKLCIKTTNSDGCGITLNGQLNLIDLAGSESVARTHACDERVREAGNINQSLLTLGRVIKALVENNTHVPYRDSKITRLLRDSLGGKAKAAIIATFSPVQPAVEETLSTLDYAYRARLVKNQPVVNQKLTKKLVLHEYLSEIELLKNQLLLSRESSGVNMDPVEHVAFMNRLRTAEEQLEDCEKQLKKRNDEFAPIEEDRQRLRMEVAHKEKKVSQAKSFLIASEAKLKDTKSHLKSKLEEINGLDAVIQAQITTESTLHKQGPHLQTILEARESDIEKLLSKVDRMTAKEEERISESSAFVSQLVHSTNDLVNNAQIFQVNSKQHSAAVCQSIEGMVGKGRESSESMSGMIEKVLGALSADVTYGHNSLVSSCNDLKHEMTAKNADLESTLKAFQKKMTDWVSDADVRLKEAQNILKTQQTDLDALVLMINKNSISMKEKNETFMLVQKDLILQSDKAGSDLRNEIESTIDGFIERAQVLQSDGAAMLNSTVQEFESHMGDVIDSMVLKAAHSNAAFTVKATSMRSDLNNLGDSHAAVIQQDCTNEAASLQVELSKLKTGLERLQTQNKEDAENLSSSNKEVDDSITATIKAGEIKLADISCQVLDKSEDFKKTTEQTQSKVVLTMDGIDKMVDTVSSSSDQINADAAELLKTLVDVFGEDGDALSEQSKKYLAATESYSKEQDQGLKQSSKNATVYEEEIKSTKLEALPDDPVSLQRHSHIELAHTRDHRLIRKYAQSDFDMEIEEDTNENTPVSINIPRTGSIELKSVSKGATSPNLKHDENADASEHGKNATLDENQTSTVQMTVM